MTHDAFEHIARELRPKLLHIGVRFFGNNATAEDIAQETLMRLWLIRERIDLQVGIEPLALRMAKNLCVSEWRKRQVRQSGWRRHDCGTRNKSGQEAKTAVGQDANPAVGPEPAAPVTHAPAVAQQSGATRAKSGTTRVKARATHSPKAVNTTDSLQYYITRLEQELAQVTDSSYTAKAEQIIRADARLQRLVRRIMAGEIERNGQPIEAMVNNEGKEDLP